MTDDIAQTDCPDCAKLRNILIDAETANAELGRQVAGLQHLLNRSGRAELALRNELAQQREEETGAPEIKTVCEYWKRALEHPKAKTPLSGARAQKVRARLRERFTVDDLKKAIDGCAKLPYVGIGGRKAAGQAKERHDDLTLICRDEETVERFIRYADNPVETASTKPRTTWTGPSGVEPLLERLEAAKQVRAGQWTARCPAHDDRHASLSIGQGDKGAVVHCHAGCTADQIAHAAGLEIAALFDRDELAPVAPRKNAPPPEALPSADDLTKWQAALAGHQGLLDRLRELRGWTLTTLSDLGVGFDGARLTFPIYDSAGTLVNVLRYLPRRQGNERKLLALRGRPRDLFPSPIADEVWLVEGEPDAVSGRELGLPAVAVPGSNGWRAEWVGRLASHRVVVCFDCDDAGRKAATRILADLSPVADVVVLDLEPERTDGYDLSDALLEGASGELLQAMADAVVSMDVVA